MYAIDLLAAAVARRPGLHPGHCRLLAHQLDAVHGVVGQLQLDEIVKKAADKKAKDDAKNGGGVLQAIEAEPEEPEFVPEERVRPGAEPTAESVFGKNDD